MKYNGLAHHENTKSAFNQQTAFFNADLDIVKTPINQKYPFQTLTYSSNALNNNYVIRIKPKQLAGINYSDTYDASPAKIYAPKVRHIRKTNHKVKHITQVSLGFNSTEMPKRVVTKLLLEKSNITRYQKKGKASRSFIFAKGFSLSNWYKDGENGNIKIEKYINHSFAGSQMKNKLGENMLEGHGVHQLQRTTKQNLCNLKNNTTKYDNYIVQNTQYCNPFNNVN